jgi:hypothetical protein
VRLGCSWLTLLPEGSLRQVYCTVVWFGLVWFGLVVVSVQRCDRCDPSSHHNEAVRFACEKGHVEVVKMLSRIP